MIKNCIIKIVCLSISIISVLAVALILYDKSFLYQVSAVYSDHENIKYEGHSESANNSFILTSSFNQSNYEIIENSSMHENSQYVNSSNRNSSQMINKKVNSSDNEVLSSSVSSEEVLNETNIENEENKEIEENEEIENTYDPHPPYHERPTAPETSSNSSSSSDTSSKTESSNVSSSQPSSNTSSEQQSIDYAEVENKINTMLSTYGVNLILAKNETIFASSSITSYHINKDNALTLLQILNNGFRGYPKSLFSKTNCDLQFILCEDTTSGNVVVEENNVLVPCQTKITSVTIKNELISLAKKLLKEYIESKKLCAEMDKFNPDNFIYGNMQLKYVYSSDNILAGCFISLDAQKSAMDDFMENYNALCNTNNLLKNIPQESLYYKKFQYFCNVMIDFNREYKRNPIIKQYI